MLAIGKSLPGLAYHQEGETQRCQTTLPVEAESRHIGVLRHLFHKYKQSIDKQESIETACKTEVEAEIENAEIYDHLLKTTADYRDIQHVMKNL